VRSSCVVIMHDLVVVVTEAVEIYNKDFPMNSHLTQRFSKHSSNVECAEKAGNSHVVECECELCHIPSMKVCIFVLAARAQ